MNAHDRPLRVALLGCGVVGTEVARRLTRDADELAQRVGAPLELVGIAVRNLDTPRDLDVPAELFTDDAAALVRRGDLDIVVEVVGGIEPAGDLIRAALEHGASVVTANKALLADQGADLFEAADKAQRDLSFEAAIAGAIPIVRPLRESLAGDRIRRVLGIVNGTTNYILDQMTTLGQTFDEALAEAQRLGYAEADPTADVEGHDAAAKAALLAGLAFHTHLTLDDVHCEGITSVTADAVQSAAEMGSVVKLLAICEQIDTPDGPAVGARVHPAMVPLSHPLASVRGAYNAVFVESEAAGELMFYGPGAGGAPTASAVLGDIVSAARNRASDVFGPGETSHADVRLLPIGSAHTQYHLVIEVDDRAGVLAIIAQEFARFGVSIKTLRQEGLGSDARLIIVTHEAEDASLAATVEILRGLEVVRDVSSVMRVEGGS
ncbi:homoserine dehydrogenase [Aeromicrobium alkaliterrae]|uniref:Homoserine dehydrogenase n=1 Tax=Aeromicrobium alkaliterrae TaxID=302168 RepID=A0ABN2JGX8_9ACTN